MRRRQLGLAVAVVLLAGVAALPAVVWANGNGSDNERHDAIPALDLKVAVRTGESCRDLRDRLPVLVTESHLEPGTATSPVEVCALNRGSSTGRLTLGISEVTQQDPVCTGEEAAVDTTCGKNRAGELAGSLVVLVAHQPGCQGPFGATTSLAFVDLATTPAVIAPAMKTNERHCTALALEYSPSTVEAGAAAQTDLVRWRYAFDLSA